MNKANSPISILLVTKQDDLRRRLNRVLSESAGGAVGFTMETAAGIEAAKEKLLSKDFDAVLLDFALGGESVGQAVENLCAEGLHRCVIVLVGPGEQQQGLEAVRKGADDCVIKDELSGGSLVFRIQTALERKKADVQLSALPGHRAALVKEFSHRLKNNLQVVFSLLDLQVGLVRDKALAEVFRKCQNRIKAISLVHETLYRSGDLQNIDFRQYVKELLKNLLCLYGVSSGRLKVSTELEEAYLSCEKAVPCGLIINELVSNSLKHAFRPEEKGRISIEFRRQGNDKFVLVVSDNGRGLDNKFDFQKANSMGLRLVNMLVKQLGGTIRLNSAAGARYTIVFESQ